MQKINCKTIRDQMLEEAIKQISTIKNIDNHILNLTVVKVGKDAASEVYVRNKLKTCADLGINCNIVTIDEKDDYIESIQEITSTITMLNLDSNVDGIILQLPLPNNVKRFEESLCNFISDEKDVDGLTRENTGRLWCSKNGDTELDIFPATPSGIMQLLPEDLSSKHVAILGRSNLVGKPLIKLLMDRNATVTCCHSKTGHFNMHRAIKDADIVISAIGQPKEIKTKLFNGSKMYIDVGINRDENGKLCGDFDHEGNETNSTYTPVPGGVGLLTTAQIALNLVKCYYRRK